MWDERTLEHFDTVSKLNRVIKEMEYPIVQEKEVKEGLKKLKNKTAAGPDKMKGEFYKALQDSEKFIKLLTESFREILENGTGPDEWKESRTIMVPKKNKPKVSELRPIAITNVSYKLFMSVTVQEYIEKHLIDNKLVKDNQNGFTKRAE